MISKEIIRDYLTLPAAQYMSNYNVMKGMTKAQAEEGVCVSRLKTEPYLHQVVGLYAGLCEEHFLFFLDMGLGKTKIVLDTLSFRRDYPDEAWNRALVVSPNAATVDTFGKEIEKHSDFSYVPLMGTRKERWEILKLDTDINIINYTGLLTILTESVGGSWVYNKEKVEKLSKMFDVLILDEIHLAKNHRSLTFKVLKELGKNMKLRYGLTGTPINRDPMALWAQFYLIDRGQTLGQTIGLFREAYFTAKNNYWGGIDYKFKPELLEHLNRRVAQLSLRYAEWEANELPEKVVIDMPIELSNEGEEYYQSILDGIVESNGNIEIIKDAFQRCRRLCSGYFKFKSTEGEDNEIEIKSNKLDTLVDLINTTPYDSKVVVFLDYVRSGDYICERLKEEKIKFERLYGGTKDKVGTKNRFIEDPKIKVLVANTKSGGVGLNLQAANYAIFYELPLSNIDYMQAMKRIHRTGQDKRTFIYHLLTKNSIEEKLMKYIKEGKDLFQALIEGKEKL